LVGSVIAERYDVVSVIGQGGMGTVFMANHRDLERPVAIKVLNAVQAAKTTSVMRFHNEARTAGSIGHPNICEVYDLGTLPTGSPYLVMEYLSGETLAACITRKKQLDLLEAIDIIAQVLAGLSAAHAKGIVHRDIKPENILLVSEPRQTVKILDFGVSKMLGDDPYGEGEDVLSLTRTGMVMGTPYYMAAEQARGERDLDSRVDVYACGVMLYEALAGKRPYIAPNYNALLLQIVGKPASRLSQHRPNIPPRAEAIVAKAMERNRDKRYGTANEFRQALTSLRDELAPKAQTKSRRARPVVPAYNIDDEDHHTLVRSEELFEVESSPTYIETERMHQEDFNPPSRKPRS
jgi:eukaryotic-like serine/threonine-protein kinase